MKIWEESRTVENLKDCHGNPYTALSIVIKSEDGQERVCTIDQRLLDLVKDPENLIDAEMNAARNWMLERA